MPIDLDPAKSTRRDSTVPVIGDDGPKLLGTPDRLAGGIRRRAHRGRTLMKRGESWDG